ncbi:AtaL-like protein [Kitasatospora sp. NPDC051853]|uniref:AtaL-like protein n=1 Tax=Kitasatospora sp. NPDC051853 TaxID=3364058 RepID=UPI0037BAF4ED
MNQFSWTLQVDLTDQQLWDGLVHKAEHPSPYVPAVTGCRVLERFEGGFLREITVRDEVTVRERVTFHPGERVVFRPVDDPAIEEIVNEQGHGPDGKPTLTLRVTLSPEGVAKAETTRYFRHETERYFSDTLAFMVEGLESRYRVDS